MKWPHAVGFNVSKDYFWPSEFAFAKNGVQGIVLPIRFREKKLVVVDLGKIGLARLEKLALKRVGDDRLKFSDLLRKAFGIDVLIVANDRHPIILNDEILRLPEDLSLPARDLAYRLAHLDPNEFAAMPDRVWDAYRNYLQKLTPAQRDRLPSPDAIKPRGYEPMMDFDAFA